MQYDRRDRVTMQIKPSITQIVNAWVELHAEIEGLKHENAALKQSLKEAMNQNSDEKETNNAT